MTDFDTSIQESTVTKIKKYGEELHDLAEADLPCSHLASALLDIAEIEDSCTEPEPTGVGAPATTTSGSTTDDEVVADEG